LAIGRFFYSWFSYKPSLDYSFDRGTTGMDINPLLSDPEFLNAANDLRLAETSPARNYATKASFSEVDILSQTSDSTPHLGAYEH